MPGGRFSDDDVVNDMELESPFDLLGLFEGFGMTEDGATPFTGQMPNRVWLYRRPSLITGPNIPTRWAKSSTTCWCTRSATISGLSDDDMERIERDDRAD